MIEIANYLPLVDALLNATSTVLLLLGLWFIKRKRREAHKRTMLACFGVSSLFLVCYLVHKAIVGVHHFPSTAPVAVRTMYFAILLSHTILAAAVPVLAIMTIRYGLQARWTAHRRLARWTFPIWLYVSVTGIVVYLMLYQLYPQ